MWEQVKTYGHGGNSQNDSREEKEKKIRLLTFQKYYVDYKEGRLERNNKKKAGIHIHFNFQESLPIPNIKIFQVLQLYNLQQLGSILYHYYDQSNVFYSVKYHPKYNDLQIKIERRKTFQSNIDQRIDELSKYLTFILKINHSGSHANSIFNITYTNLNRSTLPLAIEHLRSVLLVFKTWSYRSSDRNEVDGLMTVVSRQYKDKLPYKPFQHHFITQYQNRLAESIPTNLTINFQLLFKDSHPIFNTYPLNLSSNNQLLSLLDHYSLRKDPLDPSWIEVYKEHTDLYKEITYRSRLQTSYDRVLSKLSKRVSFRVDKDQSDPLNLGIKYIDLKGSDVPYAVKHLDTMMMVYKAWNYSPNDKLEIDNFVFLMREDVEEGFTSRLDPNISDRLDTIVSNPDKAKKDSENDMMRLVDSRLDDMIGWTRDWLESLKGKDYEAEDDKVSFLPRDVNAMDGRLGGASNDVPNLLEVSGNDISMMEDID